MLAGYFKNARPTKRGLYYLLALPVWVFVCFVFAQLSITALIVVLNWLGLSLASFDSTILQLVLSVIIYALTLTMAIGLPQLVKKIRTTRSDLGITRLPTWSDIGMTPLVFILYSVLSAGLLSAVGHFIPGFNLEQAQDVGFSNLSRDIDFILAFTALVVVAPIAEEILFRGYLYGKLRKHASVILSVIATSLLFGAVHAQWNVGLDTFVLSIVLCGLREMTGSIWAGVLVHMLKNGIAFYILFIYPSLSL